MSEMRWLAIALQEFGVKELPGDEHNTRILEYFKATRLGKPSDGDETPWCSAFACWCMQEAGISSTRSASARSWFVWGETLTVSRLGCVAVFRRGNNVQQGHVGFYISTNLDGSLNILGGNERNAVSILPYPKARLLGLRWPKDA